jgi:hypothetical protein
MTLDEGKAHESCRDISCQSRPSPCATPRRPISSVELSGDGVTLPKRVFFRLCRRDLRHQQHYVEDFDDRYLRAGLFGLARHGPDLWPVAGMDAACAGRSAGRRRRPGTGARHRRRDGQCQPDGRRPDQRDLQLSYSNKAQSAEGLSSSNYGNGPGGQSGGSQGAYYGSQAQMQDGGSQGQIQYGAQASCGNNGAVAITVEYGHRYNCRGDR